MNNRIVFGLFTLVFCFAIGTQAQNRIQSLHFMDRTIQSNITNPALYPEGSFHFGFPSLAIDFGNSGFAMRDLIKVRDDDSLYLDIPGVLDQLGDDNELFLRPRIDAMMMHMRIKKLHLTLNATEHVEAQLNYPGDLLNFAWNGNRDFIGDTMQLSPSARFSWYHEIGVGIGYDFGKVTASAKYRHLMGVAHLETPRANLSWYTDPEFYSFDVTADILAQMAGFPALLDSTDTTTQITDLLTGQDNTGYAIDLGVVIRPLKNLQIAASAINIGKINWRSNVKQYEINGTYSFDGFSGLNETNFDSILDTIQAIFDPVETEEEFSTNLGSQVFLSAQYLMDSSIALGALLRFFPDENLTPNFTFSVSKRFKKVLRLLMTYSIIDDRRNNVGFGMDIKLWKFQFFGVTDDIGAWIRPRDSRFINWRGGFNLIF